MGRRGGNEVGWKVERVEGGQKHCHAWLATRSLWGHKPISYYNNALRASGKGISLLFQLINTTPDLNIPHLPSGSRHVIFRNLRVHILLSEIHHYYKMLIVAVYMYINITVCIHVWYTMEPLQWCHHCGRLFSDVMGFSYVTATQFGGPWLNNCYALGAQYAFLCFV